MSCKKERELFIISTKGKKLSTLDILVSKYSVLYFENSNFQIPDYFGWCMLLKMVVTLILLRVVASS